ncbi:MAG: VOC family protein [Actinomycetota bacterium]|nr:VOC family protein [Actinomycetota bacterium]
MVVCYKGEMLEFDHVLVAVRDLDAAAVRFRTEFGLASVEGGRHTGLGTGNRIIPLGPDYIELIAVVDESEAEGSPLAAWVSRLSSGGDRLAALCLRVDHIDDVCERLGLTALEMQRRRPDGQILKWKLAGLEDALADPCLPFYIEWLVPRDQLPGRAPADHEVEPRGIEWVDVAGDAAVIQRRLLGSDLDVRVAAQGEGLNAVSIATDTGSILLA